MPAPRSNTEGSIKRMAPDRWLVRASLGRDAHGKRVREFRIIRGTRRDAQRYLTELLKKKSDGLPMALSRQTFGEWVAEWLKDWTGAKGPRTRRDYEQTFRRIFEYDRTLGGIQLTALTPERIQQFIGILRTRKKRKWNEKKHRWEETESLLSPRTIRIYHGALRAVLNEAMRLGKVQRNVASLVSPPALTRFERTVLTDEETRQFLAASEEDRFHALFATLIYAGLRPGEAFALRWSDLDGNRLHVQRALVWLPGKDNAPIFADTKTGRARALILSEELLAILKTHRRQQAALRLQMGASYQNQGLIFASELGGPLQLRNVVMRHFKPLLRRAKLPNIRLYDLRHMNATIQHAHGVPIKVIQERLGHSSITLTLDTYVHVTPKLQEEAAATLGSVLGSTKAAGACR